MPVLLTSFGNSKSTRTRTLFLRIFSYPVLYESIFLVPVPVLRTRTPYPYLNQYQSMLVKAVIIANLTKS